MLRWNQWQKQAGNIIICSFCGSVYRLDNDENILSKEAVDEKIMSLYIESEKCRRANNYDVEIQYLIRAMELDENRPMTWLKLGRAYRMSGVYEEAIKCYNKVISIDSKIPQSYQNMGSVYLVKKDYKKAIEYYERAMELFADKDSDYIIALGNYGIAVALNGDKKRGAKLINKAEKMGYTNAEGARKMAGLGFYTRFLK